MQNTGYPFITPSSTCLSEDLLFFDTFSHSGNEHDNFDLVQFPSPVVIDLIKIVPLGQPVEAKIPGNVRLGATNPSKCELEFYINDLTKQDAHTMTDLGQFHCSENETDFNPPLKIQTDGLLLKGNYRTLTLAIFGQIASYDEKPDEEQIIQSAASPPAQTPASPVASERDMPYIVRVVDQEYLRRARDDSGSIDESIIRSNDAMKEEILFDGSEMMENQVMELEDSEAPSKDQMILDEMSSSEGGPSIGLTPRDKKNEDENFSNSADIDVSAQRLYKDDQQENTSESADMVKTNDAYRVTDEFADQDAKEWFFNVESYQPKPLVYFYDPSMTVQERALLSQKSLNGQGLDERANEKIAEIRALSCNEDQRSDEWVTLIEDLARSGSSIGAAASDRNTLEFLIHQVSQGLDFELARKQRQTRFKVRHLRAGLKLTMALFHCGRYVVTSLLEASVPQKILSLYYQDQVSLPIRLLIFKCLSIVADSVEGAKHLIEHHYNWQDARELFKIIRNKSIKTESNESQISDGDEVKPKFEPSTNEPNPSKFCLDSDGKSKHTTLTMRRSPEKLTTCTRDDKSLDNLSFTCYQYMLVILLSQPPTRVVVAIGSLLRKLRLYSNLEKLSTICSNELEESEDSTVDTEKPPVPVMQTSEIIQILQDIVDLVSDKAASLSQPGRQLPARVQFQVISNTASTYLAIYKWLKQFQTLETLNTLLESPSSETMDSPSRTETEKSMRLQNLCLKFLELILESPKGCQFFLAADCCDCAGRLIRNLGSKRCSRRLNHVRVTDGIENCFASLCREESLYVMSHHDMSCKMSYSFKVLSSIDKLFHFHHEKRESSLHDPEKILHQLYIMSDHPYGLSAILKHFSTYGNLDCLLNFFRMPEHHKNLEFVRETSMDYVLELLGTFFRLNNNVLGVAIEYFKALQDIAKNKEKSFSVRLKSLLPWLNPFETEEQILMINYSEDTFRQLTRVIRKSIPNYSIPFAKGLDFELPPKMITAVRILRQLCIPPQVENFIDINFDPLSLQKLSATSSKSSSFMAFVESLPHQHNNNQSWNLNIQSRNNCLTSPSDELLPDQLGLISNTFILFQPYYESICGELKYHYGITQVYEQEGLKRLLNTLRELVGNYPRPVFQSAALSGLRGRIVISYINSVIVLLHSIVCHLIDARGSEFRDTSVIPVILETYSLLCFVPEPESKRSASVCEIDMARSSLATDGDLATLHRARTIRLENYQLAQQTKSMILSILMSYTQMCLSVSESEEKVISKSMWTRMLKEVVDFTLSTPVFFSHGLDVLSKILPSPLPCSSMMDSIDQEQLFKNINHRKLWSAHLHPLHQQIEQMISQLSLCYQSNIRAHLYYLCNQLCDLSSNAACMVAKIITDSLVAYISKLCSSPENGRHSSQSDQQQSQQQAQDQASGDPENSKPNASLMAESKESAYAIKMILNLLSNLITNQAFETAFTSHLHLVGKKDEKFFLNMKTILKQYDDFNRNDEIANESNPIPVTANFVAQLVESIKTINRNSPKNGQSMIPVTPPEELIKINLLDVARKTPDRFSLSSGIKKTYRLKVLLDLNSCARRTGESLQTTRSTTSSKRLEHAKYGPGYPDVAASHKPYIAPLRGRGRSSARPDSFRSRPQNTSRPPSIHVDDFMDLYGDNPSQQAAGRFLNPAGASGSKTAVDGRARRDDFRSWRPLR